MTWAAFNKPTFTWKQSSAEEALVNFLYLFVFDSVMLESWKNDTYTVIGNFGISFYWVNFTSKLFRTVWFFNTNSVFSAYFVRLINLAFKSVLVFQWRIQRLSDAGLQVWAFKLGAQIKGELMQSTTRHSIKSSTRMRLHVFRHLT